MARKAVNDEFKQLQSQYVISNTYFCKLKAQAQGDIVVLKQLLEDKKARDEARAIRKTEPPKKKRVPISVSDNYQGSYKIKTPDHLMGYDEFYLFIEKHIKKSVYVLRGKYYTLKQNNIESDDLVSEIMIKCLRKTRDGVSIYDKYVADPSILSTIRVFANTICRNHFKDYLKGIKYTTPVTSLDAPLPGPENLTIGDSVGIMDTDNISINELIEKCSLIEVSKRKNEDNKVMLSDVLEQVILGVPLTTVCHDLKVSSRVVQRRLLEAGIEDILGHSVSQERKDKILGNC